MKIKDMIYRNEHINELLGHGGLTYSANFLDVLPERSGWWIGWDYAHLGDCYAGFSFDAGGKKWTYSEIFEEVKQITEQLKHLHGASDFALFNEVPDE